MSRQITPRDVQRYDHMKFAVMIALMLLLVMLIVARELANAGNDQHAAIMAGERLWGILSLG